MAYFSVGGGAGTAGPSRSARHMTPLSYGGGGVGAGARAGYQSQFANPPTIGGGGGNVGGPQLPYQPEGGAVQGLIDPLADAGKGLLDPNSAYSQQLQDELTRNIGERTDSQQRAAQLMAARAGLGTGASPELLQAQAEIGRSGLEAAEGASADLALQSPALGASMLQPALQGQLGLQSNAMQAYLAQQRLAAAQESQQAQLDADMQRFAEDARLRELALLYGQLY